jgi:hypothetical protein
MFLELYLLSKPEILVNYLIIPAIALGLIFAGIGIEYERHNYEQSQTPLITA